MLITLPKVISIIFIHLYSLRLKTFIDLLFVSDNFALERND